MEVTTTSVRSEVQRVSITEQPHGLSRWWMRHYMHIGLASMAGSAILLCIIAVILLPIALRTPSEGEEECSRGPPDFNKPSRGSTISPGLPTNQSLRSRPARQRNAAVGSIFPLCATNAVWASQGETIVRLPNETDPSDMLVDWNGNVYIADSRNNRVTYWPVNAIEGRTVVGTGAAGSWTNLLKHPAALAIWNDRLYVSDLGNYRIMAFPLSTEEGSPDGVTIVGRYGAGPALNQINAVRALCVDEVREILYLADSENHRVLKSTFARESLELAVGTGAISTDSTGFNLPTGLAVEQWTGALYVVDSRNHRVQKFPVNSREGVTVAGGRNEGASLSQLHLPSSVALDAAGNVYVVDTGNERIVQWLVGAQQGRLIAGTGTAGDSQFQFNHPVQLRFDQQHGLYVLDRNNSRVQRFALSFPGC